MKLKIHQVITSDAAWRHRASVWGWAKAVLVSCILAFIVSRFSNGPKETLLGMIVCCAFWVIFLGRMMVFTMKLAAASIFVCVDGSVFIMDIKQKIHLKFQSPDDIPKITGDNENWLIADSLGNSVSLSKKAYPKLDMELPKAMLSAAANPTLYREAELS